MILWVPGRTPFFQVSLPIPIPVPAPGPTEKTRDPPVTGTAPGALGLLAYTIVPTPQQGGFVSPRRGRRTVGGEDIDILLLLTTQDFISYPESL